MLSGSEDSPKNHVEHTLRTATQEEGQAGVLIHQLPISPLWLRLTSELLNPWHLQVAFQVGFDQFGVCWRNPLKEKHRDKDACDGEFTAYTGAVHSSRREMWWAKDHQIELPQHLLQISSKSNLIQNTMKCIIMQIHVRTQVFFITGTTIPLCYCF